MPETSASATVSQPIKPAGQSPIVRPIPSTKPMNNTQESFAALPYIVGSLAIIIGIGTGYILSQNHALPLLGAKPQTVATQNTTTGTAQKGQTYGSADDKAFPDSTEGVVQKGGIDGEGSHKLIRPGGDSQTVYMTSSTLDLDQFVGKKVKIWGATNKSEKAGWLMDVGRLQVLE